MIGRLLCRAHVHHDRRVRSASGEEWVYRCRRCDRVAGRGPLFMLMGGGSHSPGGF